MPLLQHTAGFGTQILIPWYAAETSSEMAITSTLQPSESKVGAIRFSWFNPVSPPRHCHPAQPFRASVSQERDEDDGAPSLSWGLRESLICYTEDWQCKYRSPGLQATEWIWHSSFLKTPAQPYLQPWRPFCRRISQIWLGLSSQHH